MSDSNVQFHGGKEVKTQASKCVMNLSSTEVNGTFIYVNKKTTVFH